ncbi:hypothetical protein ABK040_005261 [Willaertia magna]
MSTLNRQPSRSVFLGSGNKRNGTKEFVERRKELFLKRSIKRKKKTLSNFNNNNEKNAPIKAISPTENKHELKTDTESVTSEELSSPSVSPIPVQPKRPFVPPLSFSSLPPFMENTKPKSSLTLEIPKLNLHLATLANPEPSVNTLQKPFIPPLVFPIHTENNWEEEYLNDISTLSARLSNRSDSRTPRRSHRRSKTKKDKAATIIQKHIRGFLMRKRYKKLLVEYRRKQLKELDEKIELSNKQIAGGFIIEECTKLEKEIQLIKQRRKKLKKVQEQKAVVIQRHWRECLSKKSKVGHCFVQELFKPYLNKTYTTKEITSFSINTKHETLKYEYKIKV